MAHQTRYIYDTGTGEVKLVIEAVPLSVSEHQIIAALARAGWFTLVEWARLSLVKGWDSGANRRLILKQINEYNVRRVTWDEVVQDAIKNHEPA